MAKANRAFYHPKENIFLRTYCCTSLSVAPALPVSIVPKPLTFIAASAIEN